MGLFGFMYWSTAEGRTAKVLAGVHGIAMSATRIVGIACAAYPVVRAVFEGGWARLRDVRHWFREYASAVALDGGRDARRDRVLFLLPPALGALGSLHGDAGSGGGDFSRLPRSL